MTGHRPSHAVSPAPSTNDAVWPYPGERKAEMRKGEVNQMSCHQAAFDRRREWTELDRDGSIMMHGRKRNDIVRSQEE